MSNWVVIGYGNNVLPMWCQAIIKTNSMLLESGLQQTKSNEFLCLTFDFKIFISIAEGRKLKLGSTDRSDDIL